MNRGKTGPRRRRAVTREPGVRPYTEQPAGGGSSRKNISDSIRSAALKMLASRPRTEGQLRERLLEKFLSDSDAVEECISHLKKTAYLDDAEFARSYASSRLAVKAVGRNRLARELEAKKVSRAVITEVLDSVFDDIGEENLIDRAIVKRIRIYGRPTDRAGAKRMFDHLARLGFQYNLIMLKLRALNTDMGDE